MHRFIAAFVLSLLAVSGAVAAESQPRGLVPLKSMPGGIHRARNMTAERVGRLSADVDHDEVFAPEGPLQCFRINQQSL